jgi:hypothetical protein
VVPPATPRPRRRGARPGMRQCGGELPAGDDGAGGAQVFAEQEDTDGRRGDGVGHGAHRQGSGKAVAVGKPGEAERRAGESGDGQDVRTPIGVMRAAGRRRPADTSVDALRRGGMRQVWVHLPYTGMMLAWESTTSGGESARPADPTRLSGLDMGPATAAETRPPADDDVQDVKERRTRPRSGRPQPARYVRLTHHQARPACQNRLA